MRPTKEKFYQLHYVEHKNLKQLSEIYDISMTAVLNWFKRFDMKYYQIPQLALFTVNRFIEMNTGMKMTKKEICEEIGVSRHMLDKWLTENNIEAIRYERPKPTKRVSKSELYRLHYVEYKKAEELADIYGVTTNTIYNWFTYYGLIYYREPRLALLTPEKFTELNVQQKLSKRDISKKLNINRTNLENWLKENQIKSINHQLTLPPSKEEIIHAHHVQKIKLDQLCYHFHVTWTTLDDLFKKYNIEKKYYPINHASKQELEVLEFVRQYADKDAEKTHVERKEIDIYSEKYKIGIEYCGAYWHSVRYQKPNSHYEKFKVCEKTGIQLLTIFDFEWNNVAKSVVLSKFGIFKQRLYARQCQFRLINQTDSNIFLDKNHIQGKSHHIKLAGGLFYQDELVAVMTFTKHHRQNVADNVIVLSRLCFLQGYQIVGGATKLFKNCLSFLTDYEKIISWSDNRWSNGSVYRHLNFILMAEYRQDYFYYQSTSDGHIVHSKQSMKKSATGCPSHITEREFCHQLGFERIYDCGKRKWEFSVK